MIRRFMFAAALAVLFVGGISTGAGGSPTSISKICSTVTRTITTATTSTVTTISTVISTVTQTVTVTSSTTTTTATTTPTTTTPSGGSPAPFSCYGVQPGDGGTCYTMPACTTAISSGLATAIANSNPGDVICLHAGTYPTLSASAAKTGDVTVRPYPGENAMINGLLLTGASHLVFQGLTIGPTGSDFEHVTNVKLINSTFKPGGAGLLICADCSQTTAMVNSNVLIDHDSFANVGPMGDEGRLTLHGGGLDATHPSGITVSNSLFAGEGNNGALCADGINIGWQGSPGYVIAGNEFTGIDQHVCTNGVHADPIQIYHGGSYSRIIGNWWHDNGDGSGGIMCCAGSTTTPSDIAKGITVANNVMSCSGQSLAREFNLYGAQNFTITHNTFGSGCSIYFATSEEPNGVPATGNVFRDNVMQGTGQFTAVSGWGSATYDLDSGQAGIGNITGTPTFTGGATPNSYGGWHLGNGSPGKNAASDGTDMGIG